MMRVQEHRPEFGLKLTTGGDGSVAAIMAGKYLMEQIHRLSLKPGSKAFKACRIRVSCYG
jgi:hypothetical protein